MKDPHWIEAYITMCCNKRAAARLYPAETWALRALAFALFGWLP